MPQQPPGGGSLPAGSRSARRACAMRLRYVRRKSRRLRRSRGGRCGRCTGARHSKRRAATRFAQPHAWRARERTRSIRRSPPAAAGLRACIRRAPARASCTATAKLLWGRCSEVPPGEPPVPRHHELRAAHQRAGQLRHREGDAVRSSPEPHAKGWGRVLGTPTMPGRRLVARVVDVTTTSTGSESRSACTRRTRDLSTRPGRCYSRRWIATASTSSRGALSAWAFATRSSPLAPPIELIADRWSN